MASSAPGEKEITTSDTRNDSDQITIAANTDVIAIATANEPRPATT